MHICTLVIIIQKMLNSLYMQVIKKEEAFSCLMRMTKEFYCLKSKIYTYIIFLTKNVYFIFVVNKLESKQIYLIFKYKKFKFYFYYHYLTICLWHLVCLLFICTSKSIPGKEEEKSISIIT